MRNFLEGIRSSFAFQLVLLHLKNNQLLLLIWLLPVAFISGALGVTQGWAFLFLDPEYLGKVTFWSFSVVGLAFGWFVMTWQLTVYILYSFQFPFLASMSRPFIKFCINNSVIPALFIIYYIIRIIIFQWYNEFAPDYVIFFDVSGFLIGFCTQLFLCVLYFRLTNIDVLGLKKIFENSIINEPNGKIAKWRKNLLDSKQIIHEIEVDTYLNERLQTRLVRDVSHYEKTLLYRVFRQHHHNAIIFQLGSVLTLVLLGMLIDVPFFQIPAGSSFFIFLAVITSLLGSISYWLDTWRTTGLIVIFFIINYAVSFEKLHHASKAYGLNYKGIKAEYSYNHIDSLANRDTFEADIAHTQQILDRWKNKQDNTDKKTKLVIVCASGGGVRASLWAATVIQRLNRATRGKLLNQTALMTGASGGMLGVAYMRELHLQYKLGNIPDINSPNYLANASKDLLNPVGFTMLTNDIFMPWQQFRYNNHLYHKDRGYSFEQQLIENSNGLFNKPIAQYKTYEDQALIPLLFITPVIINDGRRLIISPQGVSYMTAPSSYFYQQRPYIELDALDFGRFFRLQDGYQLRMATALRMNATYPYILPNVKLPSEPTIEVVDAGWRDNFGIWSACRFVETFRNWILDNTSGVVIVHARGYEKLEPIEPQESRTIIDGLVNPLGIATRLNEFQDYHQDNYLNTLQLLLGKNNIEVVNFLYDPPKKKGAKASLSLHLTEAEKIHIQNAYYLDENQQNLARLKQLLN